MYINLCYYTSESSNLLEARIKSITVFKIALLVLLSIDASPKSKIFVKVESDLSSSFSLISLRFLRRVNFSLLKKGQWSKKCEVDSTSIPHEQRGFKQSWKLCLNLCSRKWLRPRRNLVTYLIPCGLWQSKTLLGAGLINCKIPILKLL